MRTTGRDAEPCSADDVQRLDEQNQDQTSKARFELVKIGDPRRHDQLRRRPRSAARHLALYPHSDRMRLPLAQRTTRHEGSPENTNGPALLSRAHLRASTAAVRRRTARTPAGSSSCPAACAVDGAAAGAVAARPEDAMAMIAQPGRPPWLIRRSVHVQRRRADHDMCVDPYGYYGWGVYDDKPPSSANPLEVERRRGRQPDHRRHLRDDAAAGGLQLGRDRADPAARMGLAHRRLGLDRRSVMLAPTLVDRLAVGRQGRHDQTRRTAPRPTPTRYQIVRIGASGRVRARAGDRRRLPPDAAAQLRRDLAGRDAERDELRRAERDSRHAARRPTGWPRSQAEDYFVPTVTFAAHAKPLARARRDGELPLGDDFDGSGEVHLRDQHLSERRTQRSATDAVQERSDRSLAIKLGPAVDADARRALRRQAACLDEAARKKMKRPPPDDPMGTRGLGHRGSTSPTTSTSARAATLGRDRVRREHRVARGRRRRRFARPVPLEDLTSRSRIAISRTRSRCGSAAASSVMPRRLQMHAGVFYENRGVDPALRQHRRVRVLAASAPGSA